MQNTNIKSCQSNIRSIASISSRSMSQQESFMPEYRRIAPHMRNNSIQNENKDRKTLLPSLVKLSHSRNYINITNKSVEKNVLSNNKETIVNMDSEKDPKELTPQNNSIKRIKNCINIDAYCRKESKAVIFLISNKSNGHIKSMNELLLQRKQKLKIIQPDNSRKIAQHTERSNTRSKRERSGERNLLPLRERSINDRTIPQTTTDREVRDRIRMPDNSFVPKTEEEISEYIKYQNQKTRLAKIIESEVENKSKILLK